MDGEPEHDVGMSRFGQRPGIRATTTARNSSVCPANTRAVPSRLVLATGPIRTEHHRVDRTIVGQAGVAPITRMSSIWACAASRSASTLRYIS